MKITALGIFNMICIWGVAIAGVAHLILMH